MRTILFTFFFAGFALIPVLILTKGFVTTYEPTGFNVKTDVITIYATEKPGWIEGIWESRKDVVINLSRWDGQMAMADGSPHEDGFFESSLAFKLFDKVAVEVVNVVHYDGFDKVTAYLHWDRTTREMNFMRVGLLWSDGNTQFPFPRRGDMWGYSLMEKLERQYQRYLIEQASIHDASSSEG